ncbi:oxidoreductase [Pueribacillus theae]|uniref:Oxidoreductase n=1 Tax=Pueribacillus theae TaxID=2171751 RepID=A0A2U1K7H6_9BACI|nr:aldo/keto reductase [Pueribacillus theae]PWA13174.1 oxidoreductase [Pueribacillus theae]
MFNKRQLGSSELFVSEIGLGAMSFQTKDNAIEMIHYAMEQGVNFIDTADLYLFGKNEEWIGEAVKGQRDKVILATKVGNRWEEGKDGWKWDPSKDYIKKAVKKSLMRLKTDYIDLYQLHGGTIEDPIEETIEAFEELKEEGLIRYYGISSIRPNVIKKYISLSNIESVMMPYSLLDRRCEELFPLLQENNVSVIGRGPLAKGALTGHAAKKIPSDGFLNDGSETQNLIKKLGTLENRSITEVALRFPLASPTVATVIPGASKLSQLKTNIEAASSTPLSPQELQLLREWTKEEKFEKHRI